MGATMAARWGLTAGVFVTVTLLFIIGLRPGAQAADQAPPVAGDVPPPGQTQLIDNPGIYGLGPGLPGSRYAVVAGYLVRIDTASGKIQSVLRPVPPK